MNDNAFPTSPHHLECLRLINDLHDLFLWAEKMGLKVGTDDESMAYAMDFNFWRHELGRILLLDPAAVSKAALG